MQVIIKRWGNSLCLVIPNFAAVALGLSAGSFLDVQLEGDALVLSPSFCSHFKLNDLLSHVHTLPILKTSFRFSTGAR